MESITLQGIKIPAVQEACIEAVQQGHKGGYLTTKLSIASGYKQCCVCIELRVRSNKVIRKFWGTTEYSCTLRKMMQCFNPLPRIRRFQDIGYVLWQSACQFAIESKSAEPQSTPYISLPRMPNRLGPENQAPPIPESRRLIIMWDAKRKVRFERI